jgi:hypothetical protein
MTDPVTADEIKPTARLLLTALKEAGKNKEARIGALAMIYAGISYIGMSFGWAEALRAIDAAKQEIDAHIAKVAHPSSELTQ